MVSGAASKVAANVNGQAHDGAVSVDVGSYTPNVGGRGPRAAAYVTVTHPAALALEAKHGLLVRAATSAGLPVKGRR